MNRRDFLRATTRLAGAAAALPLVNLAAPMPAPEVAANDVIGPDPDVLYEPARNVFRVIGSKLLDGVWTEPDIIAEFVLPTASEFWRTERGRIHYLGELNFASEADLRVSGWELWSRAYSDDLMEFARGPFINGVRRLVPGDTLRVDGLTIGFD